MVSLHLPRPDRGTTTDRMGNVGQAAMSQSAATTAQAFASRRKILVLGIVGGLSLLIAGLALWLTYPRPDRFLVAFTGRRSLVSRLRRASLRPLQKCRAMLRLVFVGTADRPSNVLSTSKPGIAVPDMLLSPETRANDYDGMIFIGYHTHEFSPHSGPIGDETARLIREFSNAKESPGWDVRGPTYPGSTRCGNAASISRLANRFATKRSPLKVAIAVAKRSLPMGWWSRPAQPIMQKSS